MSPGVFIDGASKDGWCCATNDCHKTFEHEGNTVRTFARFLCHRVLRHAQFGRPKLLGKTCQVSHTTVADKAPGPWTACSSNVTTTWTWTPNAAAYEDGAAS